MKSLNKRVLILACTACLAVGGAGSINADTVDLGYGNYADTSTGVHAVQWGAVPTDAGLRTSEQNQVIGEYNSMMTGIVNQLIKREYSTSVPELKENILDGYAFYQLTGDDATGHHAAWLVNYSYNADAIDRIISADKAIADTGSEEDKKKVKRSISGVVDTYSRDNAEQAVRNLKGKTFSGKELNLKVDDINRSLPKVIGQAVERAVMTDPNIQAQKKQETIDSFKSFAEPVTVGATYVSYYPVQTKYGVAAKGTVRGSLNYDGLKNPVALIGYAVPTDRGLTVQVLITEDSGYDYWDAELNHMLSTKNFKGGK